MSLTGGRPWLDEVILPATLAGSPHNALWSNHDLQPWGDGSVTEQSHRSGMRILDLGFHGDFRFEVVPDPAETAVSHRFGIQQPDPGDPVIHVEAEGGLTWTGQFRPEGYPLSACFYTPSPEHLFVIAGGCPYVVPVSSPDSQRSPPILPALGVQRIPGRPQLVLWDFSNLAAYGPEGLSWWIESLSVDHLEVRECTESEITGQYWFPGIDPWPNEWRPFRVDAVTGEFDFEFGAFGVRPVLHRPVR